MAGSKSLLLQSTRRRLKRPAAPIVRERNVAPSQWGRRLARLVGEEFGVQMCDNWSKNHGTWQGQRVVIKCAKSPMPPVSLLLGTLDSVDYLWAVYVIAEGHAEIWAVDVSDVRAHGYFTKGAKVQKRVEITRRKVMLLGEKIGALSARKVDSCQIP